MPATLAAVAIGLPSRSPRRSNSPYQYAASRSNGHTRSPSVAGSGASQLSLKVWRSSYGDRARTTGEPSGIGKAIAPYIELDWIAR
jgi:hypothetical protein